VPVGHFHDRDVYHHRMPHREVTKIYAGTTIHNQIIRGNNNNLINRGIPVDRVAAASHTQIHPIRIHAEVNAPRSGQLSHDGRSLAVYRPALPAPRPSNNPRLVGEGVKPNPDFNLHSRVQRTMQRTPALSAGSDRRQGAFNPATTPARDNHAPQPTGVQRGNSIIMHGPDNANSSRGYPAETEPSKLRHGPVFQPTQPGQEDDRRTVIPRAPQQPVQPAPSQQNQLPPPTFNRPINNGPDLLQQQQQRQQQEQLQQQRNFEQRQQPNLQQQRELRQQQDLQQQRELRQRQFQEPQQPVTPAPRPEAPSRALESPRARDQNPNPGFRSEPMAPAPAQRSFEQRQAPEVRSAPPQYSAPARQENNNAGRSFGGGGGGNGNNNNNNDNNNGGGGGRGGGGWGGGGGGWSGGGGGSFGGGGASGSW